MELDLACEAMNRRVMRKQGLGKLFQIVEESRRRK